MALICPNCGIENLDHTLVCVNCKEILVTNAEDHPRTEEINPKTLDVSDQGIEASEVGGPDANYTFTDKHVLVIDIGIGRRTFMMAEEEELTIGRVDRFTTGVKPIIDLGLYGGWERGVSRMHAIIRREANTMVFRDMGSSNGTFVNGMRLEPEQEVKIFDGAKIRLGLFDLRVYFEEESAQKE